MLIWRYFGCGSGVGHYLFDTKGKMWASTPIDRVLSNMDGVLPPCPEPRMADYKAAFSRLGGLGYSALSWWDRSMDMRSGSNSTVFVSSLSITPKEMLEKAHIEFPWVFARLPAPLILLEYGSLET